MPANPQIAAALNTALKAKLTAINQYFLHARMLKHQGDMKLADDEYKASLGAMKHSDMLVEQILRLGGIPDLQELERLAIGATPADMLKNDLTLAEAALTALEAAQAACQQHNDIATSALLTKILDGQREHIDALRRSLNPNAQKECA